PLKRRGTRGEERATRKEGQERMATASGLVPSLVSRFPKLVARIMTAARPTLYLVDASLYVFRAWHSMPDQFHDAQGWPTNAVHGFARFLLELAERERPQHIV